MAIHQRQRRIRRSLSSWETHLVGILRRRALSANGQAHVAAEELATNHPGLMASGALLSASSHSTRWQSHCQTHDAPTEHFQLRRLTLQVNAKPLLDRQRTASYIGGVSLG